MYECENCEDDVTEVLRHREYGVTVTHRVTRWLCRDCHPTVPASGAGTRTRDGSAETVVTDGGAVTGRSD